MRQRLPECLISILVSFISMVLADRVMLIHKSANATIGLYNGETYIQLREGDRFAVECHSNDTIQLLLPNITSVRGHDLNKVYNYITSKRTEGGIALEIAHAQKHHTGKYTCLTAASDISFYIFVLVETTESLPQNASVSKEGRLRLRNMSASPIEIKEGQSLEILINFDMFEPSGYSLQWFKTYYLPLAMSRESVTRNITYTINNQSDPYLGGGRLFIARANAEDAGIYELVATIGDDFNASFKWKVIVHPLRRRIDDLSMLTYNSVGEDVILFGKNAVIDCDTNDNNITGITMQRSKAYDKNWININSSELKVDKYTYKSVLKINETVSEDTLYRCVDERNNELKDVIVHRVPNTLGWILGIVGVISSASFITCALFIVRQRRKNTKQAQQLKQLYAQLMHTATNVDDTCLKNDQRPLHERIDQLPYERKFEIERERICFEKLLGGGEYGSVYLCRVLKRRSTVDKEHVEFVRAAAKRPRNRYNIEHYEALVAELRVMIAIGEHPNVLCLIGAVVKHLVSNYLYVITEFCEMGDLRSFVHDNRTNYVDEVVNMRRQQLIDNGYLVSNTVRRNAEECYAAQVKPDWDLLMNTERINGVVLSTCDLISFGYQISNGMQFLASKLCIHRDLAARNIFVTKNRIIRIADFGLARKDQSIYHMKSDCPLPVRWMAPETLTAKEFSEKVSRYEHLLSSPGKHKCGMRFAESDVWSFGVLLWELFTFGDYPYNKIQDNDELFDRLCSGYHLEKPACSPKAVYEIMEDCWHFDQLDRPDFAECKLKLYEQLKLVSPLVSNAFC
ncbi:unnamed protein product [Anisakis simplex]|uniref:receptor protein-tyrosine kinase n=1 Tax=Anisakis simplex TaxID=6269 RepID=A0A0M3JRX5_ANISI|nr:unnamed protein product [Anisakis simplex]